MNSMLVIIQLINLIKNQIKLLGEFKTNIFFKSINFLVLSKYLWQSKKKRKIGYQKARPKFFDIPHKQT